MDHIINSISQPVTTTQNFQIKEPEKQAQDKETTVSRAETEEAYDAVSSQGDTLSISDEGKAANESDGVVLMSRSDTDGTVLQKKSEESDTESDSSNSTVNLSIYTETELKQMYLDGDITRVEYDEELSSREVMQ